MISTEDARDSIDLYKLYAAKRPLGYFTYQKEPLLYTTPAAIRFLKQKIRELANFTGKKLTNHRARKHLDEKLRNEN